MFAAQHAPSKRRLLAWVIPSAASTGDLFLCYSSCIHKLFLHVFSVTAPPSPSSSMFDKIHAIKIPFSACAQVFAAASAEEDHCSLEIYVRRNPGIEHESSGIL